MEGVLFLIAIYALVVIIIGLLMVKQLLSQHDEAIEAKNNLIKQLSKQVKELRGNDDK